MTLTRETAKRELNENQHRCLDRIEKKDPDATVVDWFEGLTRRGPIVLLSTGEKKLINESGYAVKYG